MICLPLIYQPTRIDFTQSPFLREFTLWMFISLAMRALLFQLIYQKTLPGISTLLKRPGSSMKLLWHRKREMITLLKTKWSRKTQHPWNWKYPGFFDERDGLKTIHLLPGIKSAGEGNSGFYVRGWATDHNLILHSLVRTNVIRDSTLENARLYFYDLNIKTNYRVSNKYRIFLSGYFGRDILGIADLGFDWGNATTTFRWNHLIHDKLFMNTSIIYNNLSYALNNGSVNHPINVISKIRDYSLSRIISISREKKHRLSLDLFQPIIIWFAALLPPPISIQSEWAFRKRTPPKIPSFSHTNTGTLLI